MSLLLLLVQPSRAVVGATAVNGGGQVNTVCKKQITVGVYYMPPAQNLYPGPNLYPGYSGTQVFAKGGGQVNAVGVRSAFRIVGISGGGPVTASNGVKG